MEEEEQQERIINNSLPPPRHYFRGVAVRCGAGLEVVVVTREHVARQTAQHSTEPWITARLHAWTVQVFAKARCFHF